MFENRFWLTNYRELVRFAQSEYPYRSYRDCQQIAKEWYHKFFSIRNGTASILDFRKKFNTNN